MRFLIHTFTIGTAISQRRNIIPITIGHNTEAASPAETFGSRGIVIWRMTATIKTRNDIVTKIYNCFVNRFLFGLISILSPLDKKLSQK
jgi:hypothetical protein